MMSAGQKIIQIFSVGIDFLRGEGVLNIGGLCMAIQPNPFAIDKNERLRVPGIDLPVDRAKGDERILSVFMGRKAACGGLVTAYLL